MIRTNTVELTSFNAVAYREKLAKGGAGIVVLMKGSSQPGIASISKTSGEAIPAKNTPKDFPVEAFAEAITLTAGMPYRKLSKVQLVEDKLTETAEDAEALPEEVIISSDDYKAIIDAYTDKKDKFSYDLLNKAMIKLLNESSVVEKMIAEKAAVEEICLYVVGAKFRDITKNHEMTNEQVTKIIEMLDEVSPKGVLKEFTEEIRKSLK